MSIESQAPILRSFFSSEIYEPQLLSREIAKFTDDTTMAFFLNAMTFHPDFVPHQQLRAEYCIIAKASAKRAVTVVNEAIALEKEAVEALSLVTTKWDVEMWGGAHIWGEPQRKALNQGAQQAKEKVKIAASTVLRRAVSERNPFLLENLSELQVGCAATYNYDQAIQDAAERGDLFLLKKMEKNFSPALWGKVLTIALTKGYLRIVSWLPKRIMFPKTLLEEAFKAPNWQKMVPCVLSTMGDEERRKTVTCYVEQLRKRGESQKLNFLMAGDFSLFRF